jgi:SAM-dependent methyltransferase
MPQALYDRIGKTYASTRRSDPRIAAAIMLRALGGSHTVVNVGAGTGAYEPTDRATCAVEPSAQMIRQRKTGTAFIVQASAEALPFRDDTFDAALALLTVHHWTDWRRGLDEMRRVADHLVVFTFEPGDLGNFWLTDTYFPEIVELVRARCPSVAELTGHLGECRRAHVAIPHDCADGFLAAYWRRLGAYLDPRVRAGISGFALLGHDAVARGVARLRSDLESGVSEDRFGHLRQLEELDVCYRILSTANPS